MRILPRERRAAEAADGLAEGWFPTLASGAGLRDDLNALLGAARSAGYAVVEIAEEPLRSGSLKASFTKRLPVFGLQ